MMYSSWERREDYETWLNGPEVGALIAASEPVFATEGTRFSLEPFDRLA